MAMSTAIEHRSATADRWLARLALAALVVAALLPLAAAGWRGILLPIVVAGQLVFVVIGIWLALAHRGLVRAFGLVLAVAAVVVVTVLEIRANLLWVVVVATILLVVAGLAGRAALRRDLSPYRTPEKAVALGAEVAVLDGPGIVDVTALAKEAVARGADLLGVAGGDGTQALVAAVAAEHHVPLLVISAGTRNHFALDLRLDREDPARCLDALRDGVEARIDLGDINGRPFVNNASFGAYAEIVDDPAYRDNKRGSTLAALPDLLTGRRGAHLVADAGGQVIDGPQAILISNNAYGTTDLVGA